jgi:GNAT superfamily N-acetyltransferase
VSVSSTRADGVVVSDDPARLDMDRICTWLAESYWANDRSRADIERSFRHSYALGAYAPTGEQIALARATTDFVSFAWIGDVVVDAAWRGQGIGTWIVRAIVDELRTHGVPRFVLGTRDAHGVYERIGFTPLRIPEIWMEIDERPNRPTKADVPIAR